MRQPDKCDSSLYGSKLLQLVAKTDVPAVTGPCLKTQTDGNILAERQLRLSESALLKQVKTRLRVSEISLCLYICNVNVFPSLRVCISESFDDKSSHS